MNSDLTHTDLVPSRVNVLGIGISVLNLDSALSVLSKALESGYRGYVTVTGVHGVMESQDDPVLRHVHNQSLMSTPDGMPMVWIGRIRGHREMSRVYGPDLMNRVFEWSCKTGRTHFFYGGNTGVAQELKICLEKKFPGLRVVGTFTPPFRPLNADEDQALVCQVKLCKPDFVWVGLSTPKQERFMAQYLSKLPEAKILIGVGAAFDFFTGRVRQAPFWIQRSGFEWLYRVCQEPRRLWKRYLRNNPLFLVKALIQLTGLREYPMDKSSVDP